MPDSFKTRKSLTVQGREYQIAHLPSLEKQGFNMARLPYSLKILLENLLRNEDGSTVTAADIEALAQWQASAVPSKEIAYRPARVLMQDFTGVPAIVDLAAMRDAMKAMGGDPNRINPLLPAEMVIDHSVQVDYFGTADALQKNTDLEFERNRERYTFLRWGQGAFDNFKVVPPNTGIVHQVNLEYLARVVMRGGQGNAQWAFPDTVVGTDSHTTMINGLGVLGWGVGGIEAEAAMLGEPISMLIPQVVGFRLSGKLPEGATATDLVLRVVQMLREKGVVGKFVEFFGPGLAGLSLADRATLANMGPEYGATCGIFPVDAETLNYLRLTGRSKEQVALVEAYCKEQGLFHTASAPQADYTDTLDLNLNEVEPALAGPKRPQDRIALKNMKPQFAQDLPSLKKGESKGVAAVESRGARFELQHGSVVIAAITSCTNTSNPAVLIAAGLLAQKAVAAGLKTKPWVKSSLAPGSKVVTQYLEKAGLARELDALGFQTVGYGCTTCIGNSGPLAAPISEAIQKGNLVAASVLSGNRNFEGRINPDCRANYLASPPLVVAYALAGRVDIDFETEPIGKGKDGKPVFLKHIWPSNQEISEAVARVVRADMFEANYADVYSGPRAWQALEAPQGGTYAWDKDSTYVKRAPYFENMGAEPGAVTDIAGARVLAVLGDSVTTDHISPAGSIKADSPAGKYLQEHGVAPKDFNSYGSRRGNHEVMMRGTFANIRLRNQMVPGVEGGFAAHQPGGEQMSIYDAAMQYAQEKVPLVILAGKEYGSGSSRDWAGKGPRLLGVRAVIAETYERIHRSNLVGMGVVPLQFEQGANAQSLGLDGTEVFEISGLAAGIENGFAGGRTVKVIATKKDGKKVEFSAGVRLDTPQEILYYRHGGILQYVLRKLLLGDTTPIC
ncbi:MAG: aconitate hydratase AcnA [Candidatus Omnitrophica bacterium]|nr:aconitate hydratase AcnA [Candidatus Omnitrophota bacterium]